MSQQLFVATNIILLQQKFCHNKHTFFMTKDVFFHDKHKKSHTTTIRLVLSAPLASADYPSLALVRTQTKTTQLQDHFTMLCQTLQVRNHAYFDNVHVHNLLSFHTIYCLHASRLCQPSIIAKVHQKGVSLSINRKVQKQ